MFSFGFVIYGNSEMDVNEDGKLSFEEFRDRTHSIFTYAHDFETKDVSPTDISAIKKFQELDVNKDKYVSKFHNSQIMP